MDRRILRGLLIATLLILVVDSFDKLAVDEESAGADEGDQVRCVDHRQWAPLAELPHAESSRSRAASIRSVTCLTDPTASMLMSCPLPR